MSGKREMNSAEQGLAVFARATEPDEVLFDGIPGGQDRRARPRMRYRVEATLELEGEDLELETRDVDSQGSGFISTRRLPEARKAVLHLPTPDGGTKRIECQVRRSKPLAKGWFEGSVEFASEVPLFSERRIEA